MSVTELVEARKRIDQAQAEIKSLAKQSIRDAVQAVFDNYPDVETVAWAQKHSEYNDEGMYPGLFGPVINAERDDDGSYGYDSFVYDYHGTKIDDRLGALHQVLEAIGTEELSDIFGDEYSVTAERELAEAKLCPTCNQAMAVPTMGVRFTTEYEGI